MASPAAIRRTARLSAPTSRSAASRRSRRSPPKRTAAAMKTATGMSRATKVRTTRSISTGSSGGLSTVLAKAVIRSTRNRPRPVLSTRWVSSALPR